MLADFFVKLCGDAEAYTSIAQVRSRQSEYALPVMPTPPHSETGSPERQMKVRRIVRAWY